MANFRVGVALLDDPDTAPTGRGVFAVGQERGAFASLRELTTAGDLLWLTDLDYSTFRSSRAFDISKSFRNDQFLRSRMSNLIKEFGIYGLPREETASLLSRIAQSTVDYAATMTRSPIIGRGSSSGRLDWILRDRVMPATRVPNADDAVWISKAMLAHAFNYVSAQKQSHGMILRFYTVPRTQMARALMEMTYPSLRKPWEHVKFSPALELNAASKLPPSFEGRAALVRAEVSNLSSERDEIAPFIKKQKKRTLKREWMALPELISYAADGVVRVSEAWVNDLEPLNLVHPLPAPTDDLLISAQLYSEAYIYALAAQTGYDENGRPDSMGYDALAAYIWARERIYMLKLAKIFRERSIGQVTTVGSLQLQVLMPAGNVQEADSVALALGLEPPMESYVAMTSERPPYVPHEHTPRPPDQKKHPKLNCTEEQWIFDRKTLLTLSPFSIVKASCSLAELLKLDSLSSDQDRLKAEFAKLSGPAPKTLFTRLPQLPQYAKQGF
jgi:hypothetical protein